MNPTLAELTDSRNGRMSGRRTRACAVTGQYTPGVRLMESSRAAGGESCGGVFCVRCAVCETTCWILERRACPTSMYATHLVVCVCVFKS